MAKKVQTLRKGLSVDDLLEGSWVLKFIKEVKETGDSTLANEDELKFTTEVVEFACKRLLEHVDAGGRVTKRTVINSFASMSRMLSFAGDSILEKMRNERITPTVLDEIANV